MKVLTPKQIEANNKKFNKLPLKEKRISIAKDVIKSIKDKYITISGGNYMYKPEIDGKSLWYMDNEESIQPYILDNKLTCTVCAMGAIFTSAIKKTNKCSIEEYAADRGSIIIAKLEGIFTKHQLRLMETAFEGYDVADVISDSLTSKAKDNYYHKYDTENEILVAIMKNVIKNNGTFKP